MRPGLALAFALTCGAILSASSLSPVARPAWAQTPAKSPGPLAPRILWKAPSEGELPLSAWTLAAQHARSLHTVNLRNAGLETLRRGLYLGSAPWFPFGLSPLPRESTRFVNFGRAGFFLARAGESSEDDSRRPSSANEGASTRGGEPFAWAALLGTSTPRELVELSAYRGDAGLIDTTSFQHFSAALSARHSRVLAGNPTEVETSLQLFWSGGLACVAALKGLMAGGRLDTAACDPLFNPAPTAGRAAQSGAQSRDVALAGQHRCVAAGVRGGPGGDGGVEIVRTLEDAGTFCYFQRARSDDRFEGQPLESRWACVAPGERRMAFPTLTDAQAVLPGAGPGEFLVYEGRYATPKLSRLVLEGPGSPRVEDLQGGGGGFGPGTVVQPRGERSEQGERALASLPEGFEGVYACETRSAGSSPAEGARVREWYFVESDLFEGRRALSPDERAFRVALGKGDNIVVEPVEWGALASRAPDIDALPRAGCLLAPAVDVKCGLKILRVSGRMALEVAAGAWLDTLTLPVRWGALGLAAAALADLETRLPHWALAAETRALREFYEGRLEALRVLAETEGGFPARPWWKSSEPDTNERQASAAHPRPPAPAMNPIEGRDPRTDAAREALLATLGLPNDLLGRLRNAAADTTKEATP
jgi:hypothetical protein